MSGQCRAVGELARSACLIITFQSPSLKLKSLIGQLGRAVQGSRADTELGVEMIRNLHSRATDTSAAAANDRCHLTKARVITAEDMAHLQEE